MKFGEGGEHVVGDRDCPGCWPDYPLFCWVRDCPGLIHAHFGDENADGDYWLFTRCDVCGC